jgi:SpoIVB peptidase S55
MRIFKGRQALAVASVVGLVLAGFPGSQATASHDAAPECPAVMPVEELQKGMIATGWTVTEGDTPVSFTAEILGVLKDGIGPGRDMIVVDVSGPVIDNNGGGIWFGMSGSPLYIGGRLVGAVALGLTGGPSSIGGVTPAEDMMKILDYPSANPAPLTMRDYSAAKVKLTANMRQRIARATQTPEDDISNSLTQLRVPVNVSGLNARGMRTLSDAIERENLPLIPYTGSSASSQAQLPASAPEAGGNFVGAISYGDVSFAAVGTATAVCDDGVLAFGHPFLFQGAVELGASAADAIAIVSDPVFGSFKLATVTDPIGIVDQDRLAGIRGVIGQMPTLIPITSTVTAQDLNTTREGQTDVVGSLFVPDLALFHTFSNIDTTFDEIGPGSSTVTWTVTGTTEAGQPWELVRTNLYADEFDISFGSVFEFAGQLSSILFNPFEEIEFTGVDLDVTVDDDISLYRIADVLVSTNGVDYVDKRRVRAHPGDTIYLRVLLEDEDAVAQAPVDLTVQIPAKARSDGRVEISAGQNDFFCDPFGGECGEDLNKAETFDEYLAALQNQPTNNELRARLLMGFGKVKSLDSQLFDRVVQGFKRVTVRLIGGDGGGGGFPVPAEPEK